ncbi:MaoC family dehydratase [Sciscionella sediminilitoris]|uniref:MaoC family dehydratase n=1 Tax=Sciscionella sediminilitoris TaxID=1445613 RepID=UPI0004DEDFDC|nr:MaoC family dehydratase [Sciscionella sp. SE31]
MTAWTSTRNSAPKIGDTASRTHLITQEDTEAWARISEDRNPLHFDEQAAAASVFGHTVAHGGVLSGIISGLIAQDLPGPGTVFLGVEWRFEKPVRIGEQVTGEVEVLEVRADKPICRLATRVLRADGIPALTGTIRTYTSALD